MDTERELEGNAIPLEQANPTLWAKIQRAKAEAAQGKRRSRASVSRLTTTSSSESSRPSGGESQLSISFLPRRRAWTVFPIRCCWTVQQQKAEFWCLMIGQR